MVADPEVIRFQEKLAAVSQALQQRRVAAFVDYRPVVCGLPLEPITLRSYTLLLAWRNAFVCGGPVTFKAIAQFVWVHHPRFGQFAHADRKKVFRHLDRALQPAFPTINKLCLFLRSFPGWRWTRHLVRPTTAERHADAIAQIREAVNEALADFPPAGDDAPPAVCSLMPQLVGLFLRAYPCDLGTAQHLVSTLPLKQLVQYLREALYRLSKGRDKLITPEEARIWSDYLGYKTERAQNPTNLN